MNRSWITPPHAVFVAALIVNIVAMRGNAQTTQLGANLYTLGGFGGTIAALVGPDGVFLVDSGTGFFVTPDTDEIMAAIRRISNAPVRFLVNTSAGFDHAGGNENFAKLGVTILGRPQVRERLMHPVFSANGMPALPGSENPKPAPEAALPVVTYDAPITLHVNGEQIEVIPVPRAHSDGDTLVHFVKSDVIMTGEIYHSVGYPNIDRGNGGTVQGLLDGLSTLLAIAGPKTKIVPGYATIADRAAVAAQRDMILVLRDRVAAMVRQGKSEDEMIDAHLNADYPSPTLGPNRFMIALYEELKASR
jgi:cyclase